MVLPEALLDLACLLPDYTCERGSLETKLAVLLDLADEGARQGGDSGDEEGREGEPAEEDMREETVSVLILRGLFSS